MDSIIRDPNTGNGAHVLLDSVTNKGLLRTYGVIEGESRYVNEYHQESYSLVLDNITPAAGGDCFCFIQNLKDQRMMIESILLKKFTADDEVAVVLGATGTRDTVTDIVPGNKWAGSANLAEGIFEEGADLAGGAATLTQASGVNIDIINLIFGQESKLWKWESALIIPKNQTLSLWAGTGGDAFNTTINFYYHMF